jgi:hypothetical protein
MTVRKEARAQGLFRNSWEPGTIYALLLQRLSDEQVHDIEDLFGKNGGAESDRNGKLYHLAHRGKCTRKWMLYPQPRSSVRPLGVSARNNPLSAAYPWRRSCVACCGVNSAELS